MTTDRGLAPGITLGLARQRARLEQALADGGVQSGWKVGFGSPSGLALLGLDGPVIGHLMVSGAVADGAVVDIAGWTGPVVETEIAAWIAEDVPPGTPASQVGDYVRALGPAIELADVDHPPADVERILAGNIFHRAYLLGTPDESMTLEAVSRLRAVVTHGGDVIEVPEPTALTGDLAEVIARTARLAPAAGRELRAGDVILLGSIVPPRPLAAGDHCDYRLGNFPTIRVSVTG